MEDKVVLYLQLYKEILSTQLKNLEFLKPEIICVGNDNTVMEYSQISILKDKLKENFKRIYIRYQISYIPKTKKWLSTSSPLIIQNDCIVYANNIIINKIWRLTFSGPDANLADGGVNLTIKHLNYNSSIMLLMPSDSFTKLVIGIEKLPSVVDVEESKTALIKLIEDTEIKNYRIL
jgi:hypothetical protein